MTQEEAVRRRTGESYRVGEQIPSTSLENLGSPSIIAHGGPSAEDGSVEQSPSMSPAVEKTMRKAQKQADKATPAEKGRSRSEEEKPDRTLGTTDEPRSSATLPVVSESGESRGSSEKRALSPPNEADEMDAAAYSSSIPRNASIPGVRRVSPSTVATATDMEDNTSISSPQAIDFEPSSPLDDGESVQEQKSEESFKKPPRIGSDLIQPQSPLEFSVMKSLDQQLRSRADG